MKSLNNTLIIPILILLGLFILTWDAFAGDSRVHVAIIDTGIDLPLGKPYMCTDGNLDLTGKGLQDVNGHGTNIAGIIAKTLNTSTHCLQIIKWYHTSNWTIHSSQFPRALYRAVEFNAKYVNMSLVGTDYSEEEKEILAKMTSNGVIVAVAAGNNGQDLDKYCSVYPACYSIYNSNFIVVGNKDNLSSNIGSFLVKEHGYNIEGFGITMSGTSQSTAVYLSKRIK